MGAGGGTGGGAGASSYSREITAPPAGRADARCPGVPTDSPSSSAATRLAVPSRDDSPPGAHRVTGTGRAGGGGAWTYRGGPGIRTGSGGWQPHGGDAASTRSPVGPRSISRGIPAQPAIV